GRGDPPESRNPRIPGRARARAAPPARPHRDRDGSPRPTVALAHAEPRFRDPERAPRSDRGLRTAPETPGGDAREAPPPARPRARAGAPGIGASHASRSGNAARRTRASP